MFLGLAGLIGLGAATAAVAQTTDASLARANNCLGCHQVDRKRVGPAFTVIAQRFAHSDGARDYLAGVIRRGSKGSWGAVPMPAQTQVSPADARLLADWILSLAEPAGAAQADPATAQSSSAAAR